MSATQQIFANLNNELKKRLLPEPTETIYCNMVTDPFDIAFDYFSALSLQNKQPIKKLIKT